MKNILIYTVVALASITGKAQTTPAATGLKRTDLQQHDLSIPGREAVQVRVDIAPGVLAPAHKHPGEEIIYVLEGTLEYEVEGRPPVTLKAGQVLFIPYGKIHSAKNVGKDNASELATYIVEKGKPLVTQAQKHDTHNGPPDLPPPGDEIRPFHVNIPQAKLTDLRQRIRATRWPESETVTDATQGVQLATMKALANYWATDYDWRKCEAKLNAVPQFITTIDGLDIHFIHVRSKHKNALPVIITHGWPGSVIEQMKIIGPLTDPTAFGGRAEDAFDVVIPSLPGYGFSGKPNATGWDPVRVAKAWITLMQRLGYKKYVAQGGDWGDAVTEQMAVLAPPELAGIHTNMAATVPAEISKTLQLGGPAPAGLSPEEQHAFDQLDFFYKHGLSYAQEMSNRPQTLYGIADSPIGLAAWMLDHDARSYELIARVFDGRPEGLTKDDILDNVTLYWLTNTAVSSARLYWENKLAFFDVKNITIPVAVSAFPDELYQVPRSWAEKAFPHLIHYNKLDKGGHFAAWEQPQAFSEELRASFKSLR